MSLVCFVRATCGFTRVSGFIVTLKLAISTEIGENFSTESNLLLFPFTEDEKLKAFSCARLVSFST